MTAPSRLLVFSLACCTLQVGACERQTTDPGRAGSHGEGEVEVEAGAQQLVAGTRVYLRVPAGHEPGRGFDGYQWPATGASLIVMELPDPRAEIVEGLSDAAALARNGMTLTSSERVSACGGEASLVQVEQTAQGVVFRKWIMACSAEGTTLLLNAIYPASYDDELSQPFRDALLGVRWDRTIPRQPNVDWSIAAPPGLELAHETSGNFMYSRGGVVEQTDPGAPIFVVGSSLGTVAIEDLQASAEARFRQLATLDSLEITRSGPLAIAGHDAWEIVGRAFDRASHRPLAIHQVMVLRDTGYILTVGMVDADAATEWIEHFRVAASSWQPR